VISGPSFLGLSIVVGIFRCSVCRPVIELNCMSRADFKPTASTTLYNALCNLYKAPRYLLSEYDRMPGNKCNIWRSLLIALWRRPRWCGGNDHNLEETEAVPVLKLGRHVLRDFRSPTRRKAAIVSTPHKLNLFTIYKSILENDKVAGSRSDEVNDFYQVT
jgi:hypothetical protein